MPLHETPVKQIGFDAERDLPQSTTMMLRLTFTLLCLAALVRPALADFTLTILHTNDVHSRFEPISATDRTCTKTENLEGECFGGAARLFTAIQDARRTSQHSVLVDGGDQFQGSLLFRRYKGELTAELMNSLGYDVMALGNHEFGSGPDALRSFADAVRFPVLTANGDLSQIPSLANQIRASVVLKFGAEQIGFIGIAPEDTAETTNVGSLISFSSPEAAVRREVNRLTAEGVDKIILLSHSGYSTDLRLAETVDGIDVIVGGHSHTLLHNDHSAAVGPYPTMVGQTAIVQAYAYGKYLGRLDVTFDDTGRVQSANGNPRLLDQWVQQNPFVKARIEEASAPLIDLREQIVGTAGEVIGIGRLGCRAGECPLGNLVADAMLTAAAGQGAEVALMNGGGIKAMIEAGPVTMEQVLTVLPFENALSTFKLSGQQLKDALENGVSEVHNGAGRFPQVAGMRFTFKPFAPKGERIAKVEVGGEPLDLERNYVVASHSFLRSGGDGYQVFRAAREAQDDGQELADVVAKYLSANSPYTPFTDGRIEILID